MKRASLMILALAFAGAGTVHAQANPISTNLKADWSNISGLLAKEADKMPDDGYRFKPTADVQDFGQRMAHIVGFNMRMCSMLAGQQKTIMFSQAPTKDEITMAMKQANDACDAFFASLTDADLTKMITAGRGGPRMELAVIEGNILEHSQECYGYDAVYLRLKGVVPPSSDRNEK